MDNHEQGDGLDRDPSEPAEAADSTAYDVPDATSAADPEPTAEYAALDAEEYEPEPEVEAATPEFEAAAPEVPEAEHAAPEVEPATAAATDPAAEPFATAPVAEYAPDAEYVADAGDAPLAEGEPGIELAPEYEPIAAEYPADPDPGDAAEYPIDPDPAYAAEYPAEHDLDGAVYAPEPEPESVYEDVPTAAHSVFAPPTAAAATFAAGPAAAAPAVEVETEADEDDDDGKRKGVGFATKALVVGAAWVLLVLFLIGQFSKENEDPGLGPVGLDQTEETGDGTELAAGEEGAEGEEPVDVDGDGEIEPGEPGFGSTGDVEGASAGGGGTSGSGGGTSGGTSGSSGGSTGGGGTGDGTGDDAAPVTLPGGAPAPTTTTTTKGGGGGGATTTSTTTKPGGGGGGSTSTTAPNTTTTQAPFNGEVVHISAACMFDRDAVEVSAASITVRFVNDSGLNKTIRYSGDSYTVPANGHLDRTFSADKDVVCRVGTTNVDSVEIDVNK